VSQDDVSTNPDEDLYLEMPDTGFLTKARISAWEEGKTFTTNWAAEHFFAWAELLHPLERRPVQILEIGSWEGRSALFFLNYLPLSRITCVDTFGGNVEHHLDPYFAALAPKAEAQFDANLAQFTDRLDKRKGSSATVLPELAIAGRRFDLAYIDGSHMAADVYRDAALSWPLIQPGGLVLFDDYLWDGMEHEHERPKLGVDAFLEAMRGRYREVKRGYQLAITKL